MLQVFFVGLTIGLQRNVIPALAEQEFGVPAGSFALLTAFIVSFGFVKGALNFVAGRLSDRIGRKIPIVAGLWTCSAGIALTLFGDNMFHWTATAAISGVGMALLYPTLIAAVGDISHPSWRGSSLGVYRFWRDLGYGIGALLIGVVADAADSLEVGFWFTAVAMGISGLWVLLAAEETHPRLASSR